MVTISRILPDDRQVIHQVGCLEKEIFVDAWNTKEVENTVNQKHSFCAVAQEGGDVLGYFLCYYVLDECEIARIAVGNAARRKGIGQQLFDYLLSFCKENQIERLLLDVRESNAAAIAFYQKNQFVVDGVRKNFYGGLHPENAILMSRNMEDLV